MSAFLKSTWLELSVCASKRMTIFRMTERKAVESADEMGQESAGMLDSEPSEMLRSRVHGPQDGERVRQRAQ